MVDGEAQRALLAPSPRRPRRPSAPTMPARVQRGPVCITPIQRRLSASAASSRTTGESDNALQRRGSSGFPTSRTIAGPARPCGRQFGSVEPQSSADGHRDLLADSAVRQVASSGVELGAPMPSRTPGTRPLYRGRQSSNSSRKICAPNARSAWDTSVRCGCAAPDRSVGSPPFGVSSRPRRPSSRRWCANRVPERIERVTVDPDAHPQPVGRGNRAGQGARCSAYRRGRQHSYVARTPAPDCAGKTSTSGHAHRPRSTDAKKSVFDGEPSFNWPARVGL